MKPFKILIFFMAVIALLLGLSFLIPEDGIILSDNARIKFIHPGSIFQKDTIQYADISTLIDLSDLNELSENPGSAEENKKQASLNNESKATSEDNIYTEEKKTAGLIADMESSNNEEQVADKKTVEKRKSRHIPSPDPVAAANVDSLKKSIGQLQCSESGRALLHGFFSSLDQVKEGSRERVRILHYGDSQIESDRMTSLFRSKLQETFGGYGLGLVTATKLNAGSLSYTSKYYGDFKRYTVFGRRDTSLNHNCYGVMGSFTSIPQAGRNRLPELYFRFYQGRRTSQFNRIKLYLHSYADSSSIIFNVNDERSDTIPFIDGGYNVISYHPDTIVNQLVMEFDFLRGGRLYGISYESKTGVQIDNIAMRGSSGLVFSRMDGKVYREMNADIQTDLVIMQFGGNVVPYINDPNYYKRTFKRELAYLKELAPGVPFIIIGPADMSIKDRGNFVTHPSLEPVNEALRNAALESGFIFWDLFKAMGGRNSMPSFLHSDPPLARPDYVHFSVLGAKLMAEMFYNALMMEYSEYKLNIDKEMDMQKLAPVDSTQISRQPAVSSRQSAVGSQQSTVSSRQSAVGSQQSTAHQP